jgi:antitoxin component HigA of HigAB toxin-antitoxin module
VYFEREPKRGTAEADRFDVLAMLIEAYESKHWPIEPPDRSMLFAIGWKFLVSSRWTSVGS